MAPYQILHFHIAPSTSVNDAGIVAPRAKAVQIPDRHVALNQKLAGRRIFPIGAAGEISSVVMLFP
jgi:hypothetical protein